MLERFDPGGLRPVERDTKRSVRPAVEPADNSEIPGLRRYASVTGAEVVLNGNTREGSVDQYLLMVQEKEIAGCSERNPDFFPTWRPARR